MEEVPAKGSVLWEGEGDVDVSMMPPAMPGVASRLLHDRHLGVFVGDARPESVAAVKAALQGKFVEKAYNTKNFTGVFLLPASTHTKYFHEWIYHNPNCEVRFLRKPVKGFRFGHDDGTEDDPTKIGYIKPLMIVIFRNK